MPKPTIEELNKLNDLLASGLNGKPDSFWLENDVEGKWWFSLRVENNDETDGQYGVCSLIMRNRATLGSEKVRISIPLRD